jgi:hypothetical protein
LKPRPQGRQRGPHSVCCPRKTAGKDDIDPPVLNHIELHETKSIPLSIPVATASQMDCVPARMVRCEGLLKEPRYQRQLYCQSTIHQGPDHYIDEIPHAWTILRMI